VLTALAHDPGERYPNTTGFTLALRQAVSQQPEKSAAFASATTLTLSAPIWTPRPSEVHQKQRGYRRLLMLALAVAILVASLGGVFVTLQHGGGHIGVEQRNSIWATYCKFYLAAHGAHRAGESHGCERWRRPDYRNYAWSDTGSSRRAACACHSNTRQHRHPDAGYPIER
jgi:hypothetical protein